MLCFSSNTKVKIRKGSGVKTDRLLFLQIGFFLLQKMLPDVFYLNRFRGR